MKRLCIFLIIFISVASVYQSAAQRTYIVNFNQSEFTIGSRNSKLYIQPSEQKYLQCGDSLSPAIPFIPYRILIPNDIDTIEYQTSYNQNLLYSHCSIEANMSFIPTNTLSLQSYDIPSATQSSLDPVVYEGIQTLDGNKFACFKISPFTYNLNYGRLYFSPSIILFFPNLPEDNGFYSFSPYENTNPLETVYYNDSLELKDHQEYSTFAHRDYYDYLIITSNDLAQYFTPLCRWKSTKGLRVKLVTRESIGQNYPGGSIQEKIKNCISYYYHSLHIKYVVLGGDASVIPAKMIPIHYNGTSNITPCDLYYACLKGAFNWDGNGNGVAGEPGDSIDLAPQVSLTRIPATTASDVTAFVTKIIDYETNPLDENYVCNFLNVGSMAFGISPYLDPNYNDSRYYLNKVYSQYIVPYWNGNKYWYYQGDCHLIGNDQYNYVENRGLSLEIDKGYHLINEYSHGQYTSWILDNYSLYSTTEAEGQTNEGLSIIVTNACHTNAFDQNACLSKSLLNNPSGGALTYFGSSREGWVQVNGVVACSVLMDALFFKHLFKGDPIKAHSFGSVARQAKLDLAGEAGTWNNPYRWLQFSVNAMGDPEMPIYTQDPLTFTNVGIQKVGSSTVIVNTGGVDSCTIAITSSSDYGQTYLNVARNVSSYTFYHVPISFNICITHHNYTPLVYYNYNPTMNQTPDIDVDVNPGLITVKLQSKNMEDAVFVKRLAQEQPSLAIRNIVMGNVVYETRINSKTTQIDTSGWNEGLYLVTINDSDTSISKKVLIK